MARVAGNVSYRLRVLCFMLRVIAFSRSTTMENSELNRRDFQRLTMAALGGLMAGAGMQPNLVLAADDKPKSMLDEPHVCRGLNGCKNKGGCGGTAGKNDCAGQGGCATAEKHECGGSNACKGQGGCGANPGENACKTKGACAVPLTHAGAWEKARMHFEAAAKKAGKKIGPAPKKKS